jgi:hypothetical protein
MARRDSDLNLAAVLRGFEGKWVAVKDGKVVEARESPYVLIQMLREKHLEDASVIRAPAEGEPEMVGFG